MRTKTAEQTLTETPQDAPEAAGLATENTIDKISTATEQAIASLSEKVGPALSEAVEKLTPLVEDAKAAIVPAATSALAAGKAKSRKTTDDSDPVDEPKKKHRVRKLLIVMGIAAAVAFVVKKMSGGKEPSWTQAPSSSGPSGAAMSSTAPVDGSDTAPTAPLASEETVESPVPTTPDEPLEEKEV